jgi:lysophospholipase L1-like esterase
VNTLLILFGILVGAVALLESGLRYLGFGNPLLYQADPAIGYLLSPNQKVRRMNNRIWINQYSMRSDPIAEKRPEKTLRVLLIGDSIANGGWWTDQAETISSLLEEQLKSQFSQVEVLNASANSWGPRNQLAYLKHYGAFDAQIVILLLNTDDLFSGVPRSEAVGRDINYPDRKPACAIAEVLNRFTSPAENRQQPTEKDIVGLNLAAIEEIHHISQANQTQLIIAITPLLREIENAARDYEQRAKKRLTDSAQAESIPLIDFLPRFKQVEPPNSIYRDRIHITPEGNKMVSQTLSQAIEQILK